MKTPSPPKLAIRILEWYCRPELLEDLEGALNEYYQERISSGQVRKAKWMFFLDVIMHFRPHTIKRKSQNSTIMLQNHFKISWRVIWKNKLSSLLNTLGLATGITSFLLIFLWVEKEVTFDSFHKNGDRIYRIPNTFRSESETFSQAVSGPALGAQLHKIYAEVEHATRFFSGPERIKIGENYFLETGIAQVDPNFLEMFSFELLEGSKQTALADPFSIILTESTAKKYFGDEPSVGKSLMIDQVQVKVTGVIVDPPENSQLQFNALIPVSIIDTLWGITGYNENWGGGWFHTYLQLAPGTDPKKLEEDITTFIGERLTDWAEHGMFYDYFLQPLEDIHLRSSLRYDFQNGDIKRVQTFMAAAIVILLLACINYINLATANAINRSKEVGVRKVIGAGRPQLITQYLTESTLIVSLAVILAVSLVYLFLPMFGELTGYQQIELLSLTNMSILLGLVLVLGLLSGLLPALLISRVSTLKVIKGNLKSGSQYNLLRKGLVITQFAATIVLLISIFVINDQMSFIQKNDLGMRSDAVLHITFGGAREVRDNKQVLKDKLLQLSEVNEVSFLRNSYPVNGLSNSGIDVETGDGTKVRSSIYTLRVDESFAKTFGVELVSGRFFSKDFPADTLQSVVVNEACIAAFGWKDPQDALGKVFGQPPNERKVIGVIRNFNFEALHKRIEPVRVMPVWNNRYTSIAINASITDVTALYESIESVWQEVVPTVPLDLAFMNDDLKEQYTAEFNFKSVFTIFSVISIIIGCLGLFGLATATTNQRLREVSIRKVLGASVTEIVSLINKDFVILVIVAGLIASPIAWYLMDQWLEGFSYRVSFKWQFAVLALAGALVLTVVTISIKAFKTAFTNPAHVLKDE